MSIIMHYYKKLNTKYKSTCNLTHIYKTTEQLNLQFKNLLLNALDAVYIHVKDLSELMVYIDIIFEKISKGVYFYIKYIYDKEGKLNHFTHHNIQLKTIIKYERVSDWLDFSNKILKPIFQELSNNYKYIVVDGKLFLLTFYSGLNQQLSYLFHIQLLDSLFYAFWLCDDLCKYVELNDFIFMDVKYFYEKILPLHIEQSQNYIYIESSSINLEDNNPFAKALANRIYKAWLYKEDFKICFIINRRIYSYSKTEQLVLTCNNAKSLNILFKLTNLSYDDFCKYCSIMFIKKSKENNQDVSYISNLISIDSKILFLLTNIINVENDHRANTYMNELFIKINCQEKINFIEQSLWYQYLQKNTDIHLREIFYSCSISTSILKKYKFTSDYSVYDLLQRSKHNLLNIFFRTTST